MLLTRTFECYSFFCYKNHLVIIVGHTVNPSAGWLAKNPIRPPKPLLNTMSSPKLIRGMRSHSPGRGDITLANKLERFHFLSMMKRVTVPYFVLAKYLPWSSHSRRRCFMHSDKDLNPCVSLSRHQKWRSLSKQLAWFLRLYGSMIPQACYFGWGEADFLAIKDRQCREMSK